AMCSARVLRDTSSRRHSVTIALSTTGPIQIGHATNVVMPNSAKRIIHPDDGCSSHDTSAHQAATANSSATTCAQYECSTNEPITYASGMNSSATAATAAAAVPATRRATRNTKPILRATVSATTAWAA